MYPYYSAYRSKFIICFKLHFASVLYTSWDICNKIFWSSCFHGSSWFIHTCWEWYSTVFCILILLRLFSFDFRVDRFNDKLIMVIFIRSDWTSYFPMHLSVLECVPFLSFFFLNFLLLAVFFWQLCFRRFCDVLESGHVYSWFCPRWVRMKLLP